MSDKIAPIYAPSLYWFAYQYHRGLVTSNDDTPAQTLDDINPQWVRAKYGSIFNKFKVDLPLDIRLDEPSKNFDLLVGADDKRAIKFFTTKQDLEGFIYPQCLHDSYALNLNIYQPENPGQDEYQLADLAKFNPENCFKPEPESAANLGQTLLLSAYLNTTKPEHIRDLEPLAREGWIKFFHLENGENLPRLYRAYNLLGGYLYEYGSPKADLQENPYGHLLTWFLFEEQPTVILQKCYWELPELLLYYHKIAKSFQDSRIYYHHADRIVTENEIQLSELHQNYLNREKTETLSAAELQKLKITLKTLLATSLNYSQQLRNMEYARNTIAINSKNYQTTLERMEQLADTTLKDWRLFYEKEAIAFQEQIRADLNYFNPGSNLLNQAIATIRGLVEIDQAERDRHIQEKQQQLEDHIQALGVGIAGGAIVASCSGLLFEQQRMTFPWEAEFGKYPHPFLSAIAISSLIAYLAFKAAQYGIKKRRSRS
ncbi:MULTISPECIES: hypothetical protein [Limnospira]|uniref:hypothetical protein n=1 Tax=Limnospira TaxID=2596745 RepID=UPI00061AD44F|nr:MULTISPECIES: hypothetical protein [Limnospira]MDT9233285.1 hypothetical protein [Limnospira sp. PMC 917.15]QNH56759.1 MAG: hypothetical protein H2674_21495 [Limnospira indica BM01]